MRLPLTVALLVFASCEAEPSAGAGLVDVGDSNVADDAPAVDASADTSSPGDADPDDAASPDLAESDTEALDAEQLDVTADTGPAAECSPEATECVSYDQERRCVDGKWVTGSCDAEQLCLEAACGPRVCEPNATICKGAQRQLCDSIGSDWLIVPCPSGFGCKDSACTRILPNVVLIVDTSGSMAFEADPDGDCAYLPCGGFTFPICEDPAAPSSRIGRTKTALAALFASPLASSVRLALQRFPQTGSSGKDCAAGYYSDLGSMTGDTGQHATALSWFAPQLSEIMAVAFDAETGVSDLAALQSWVDFDESVAESAGNTPCTWDSACPDGICLTGKCAEHTQPELRAIGETPLGQSLFYAGEYFRHFILIEGKECADDSHCASSPDHTCVEGKCHDVFAKCRQNAIVLFTDGEETSYPDTSEFFNPWVQAKRLHFGLGCTSHIQCVNGAQCEAGFCTPTPETAPFDRCAGSLAECEQDSDCPDYYCGSIDVPCKGECVSVAFSFQDDDSGDKQNYLKGWANNLPIPLTIHVADASGGVFDNAAIAGWGGGKHVPIDFANAASILEALSALVDIKQGAACE